MPYSRTIPDLSPNPEKSQIFRNALDQPIKAHMSPYLEHYSLYSYKKSLILAQ